MVVCVATVQGTARAVGAEEGVKKWVGAGNREKGKEIEEQESCDMVMMR